ADADADGFGDPAVTIRACSLPAGYGSVGTDCDDTSAASHPFGTEVCDPADTDEDCNGVADDADAGVASAGMSSWYADGDGDGYGDGPSVVSCDAPVGDVATDGDCDDTDATISPSATELCDAADTDEDCDGLADDADRSAIGLSTGYHDGDSDGYGDA